VPQAPGTAAAGSSGEVSRGDHRHAPLIRKSVGTWGAINLPASQAAPGLLIDRYGQRNGTTCPTWIAQRAGSITAICVDMGNNITAETAEFQVQVNGASKTAAGEVLNCGVGTGVGGSSRYFRALLASPIALAAGDQVVIRVITTAGFLPVSLDPTLDLEITETA
jgi:hypothetical protein